jgi:CheY-like chemotaxis protein
MDISMPVMDGLEATRRIREFERENKLPQTNIIALTGLASADAQRDAESAGVDVFMPKPVRFAELKKLVNPS